VSSGKDFNSKFGVYRHSDFIGLPYGSKVGSRTGRGFIHILRPTPELWTMALPHRTQILYLADIAFISSWLDIKPGSKVIEAGTSECFHRRIPPRDLLLCSVSPPFILICVSSALLLNSSVVLFYLCFVMIRTLRPFSYLPRPYYFYVSRLVAPCGVLNLPNARRLSRYWLRLLLSFDGANHRADWPSMVIRIPRNESVQS
jgi:tRNA methyltransferase complex GCD14 subunit